MGGRCWILKALLPRVSQLLLPSTGSLSSPGLRDFPKAHQTLLCCQPLPHDDLGLSKANARPRRAPCPTLRSALQIPGSSQTFLNLPPSCYLAASHLRPVLKAREPPLAKAQPAQNIQDEKPPAPAFPRGWGLGPGPERTPEILPASVTVSTRTLQLAREGGGNSPA